MLTSIPQFERFFRAAASLDIDKEDLRRYHGFLDRQIYDLMIRAQAAAKANARDIIHPHDLPITRGLQERIHEFRTLDAGIDLKSVLKDTVKHPMVDLDYDDETRDALPEIAGALTVALARSFRIVDPELKNPMTWHWDRVFALFDLLL
jgi:hypothetical protein